MPSGLSRPYGHQGLVEGDEGGTTPPPPTPGFLSTIYAAGLADDPSVDNLMTGPLQEFFVNLGGTPPPFPPTNPAFFPESALFVGEAPADTGVGADSKPMWRMRRHFSTFPSVGDQVWYETRYDLFGGGINTISGGDRNQHVLVDQFENRLAFGFDSWQLTRPGLNAPGYTPTYLDNSIVTYHEIIMLDALGSGNANDWQFNSDGSQFRRVFIPNVTGGGGGPAGPWSYVADAMSMWSRNGGEPLIGSRLYYDAITAQTFGAVDDSLGQLMLAESVVLDAKNLGSGQAAGHGERWARSTLGGPLTLIAQLFDTGYIFPQGIGTSADSTFGGTTDTFTGNVQINGTLNGGAIGAVYETPELNFFAAPGTTVAFNMPTTAAGTGYLVLVNRLQNTARDGTVTTGPVVKIGNNGAHDNWLNSATPVANTATVKNAWLTPFGTPALPIPDGSAGPLVVELVTAAVTGTATTFKGKFFFQMVPVALAP